METAEKHKHVDCLFPEPQGSQEVALIDSLADDQIT